MDNSYGIPFNKLIAFVDAEAQQRVTEIIEEAGLLQAKFGFKPENYKAQRLRSALIPLLTATEAALYDSYCYNKEHNTIDGEPVGPYISPIEAFRPRLPLIPPTLNKVCGLRTEAEKLENEGAGCPRLDLALTQMNALINYLANPEGYVDKLREEVRSVSFSHFQEEPVLTL